MAYEVDGKTIAADEEGYIVNLADWSEPLAAIIAKSEGLEMTPNHWEVVNFLREYYNEFQIAPAIRVLTKAITSLRPRRPASEISNTNAA